MLYSFDHVHATSLHLGMRARSTLLRTRGLGPINIDMLKMLRAFGRPVQNMLQHHAKMLQDVALKYASVWPGLNSSLFLSFLFAAGNCTPVAQLVSLALLG